jgi:hypothetical protein
MGPWGMGRAAGGAWLVARGRQDPRGAGTRAWLLHVEHDGMAAAAGSGDLSPEPLLSCRHLPAYPPDGCAPGAMRACVSATLWMDVDGPLFGASRSDLISASFSLSVLRWGGGWCIGTDHG